jgi:hypothetical protein
MVIPSMGSPLHMRTLPLLRIMSIYCNSTLSQFARHWEQQQAWMVAEGLTLKKVIQQSWYPTYLEHYNVSDVMERKPWRVNKIQLLDDTRTLYIGGSAAFESVEDSFEYNLELVHRLFDSPDTAFAVGTGGGGVGADAFIIAGAGAGAASPVQTLVPAPHTHASVATGSAGPNNYSTAAYEQVVAHVDCNAVNKFITDDATIW